VHRFLRACHLCCHRCSHSYCPAGPVTGLETSTTVEAVLTYNAAAAVVDSNNHTKIGILAVATSSVDIKTNHFAPAVLTQPSSHTITKFSYTTAVSVNLPIDILTWITPIFITTYVLTENTDLGNQVTTTYECDIVTSICLQGLFQHLVKRTTFWAS
jgi:hypothetical protein